jgi:N-acetylmuramic acid 6-phosphate (MurNAc-6-P) etherase
LNPSNVKLRDRAVRIVQELTGRGRAEAAQALEESGWVIKKAWKRLGGELSKRGRAGRSPRRSGPDR